MGIEKFTGQMDTDNMVLLRFSGVSEDRFWYGIQPDIKTFPVYCSGCNRPQSIIYVHKGSRYGYVGTIKCEHCGSDITVTDHDNIVGSIILNQAEVSFYDLYLLQWKVVQMIESRYHVSIKNHLLNIGDRRITVNQLRLIIENQTGIQTSGTMKFITDSRFSCMPRDINQWLELLYKADLDLEISRHTSPV